MASFGGTPRGPITEKMRASAMYHDGEFANQPFVPTLVPGTFWSMTRRQLFGSEQRVPELPIQPVFPEPSRFSNPPSVGLRAVWFGHASVMVEIDGVRFFTDPILSERASPLDHLGPVRFFAPPIALKDLPKIDAVVISHDHYDHLDMKTVRFLAETGTVFFVPLGVGSHLEAWRVPAKQIVELDWWESGNVRGVQFVCTPAVHYSGRGLFNRNSTLWSSWSVIGPKHRFFHSGDTGFSGHFAEIGKKLGPFDLTSVKIGAYDVTWEGIHMNPEDAVASHAAVRGKRMLPVHWGTFNLAIHDWDEPIRRAQAKAAEMKIDLVTPKPGEIVDADAPFASSDWWAALRPGR
ncbi:MAG: MBL fold metallo-hydrolase [Spirochaetia bacterium]|nr:MBL fold metallo-hydrolase [Spirochaetia bacterium]